MDKHEVVRRARTAAGKAVRASGRALASTGRVIDRGKSLKEQSIDKGLTIAAGNVGFLYGISEVIERTDFSDATNGLLLFTAGVAGTLGNYHAFVSPRVQPARDALSRLAGRIDVNRPLSWLKTASLAGAILYAGHGLLPHARNVAHDVNTAFLELTAPKDRRAELSDLVIPDIPSHTPKNLRQRPPWYDAVGHTTTTEHDFTGTTLKKKDSIIGRVQRTLRWQPLYRAVERKYGMPESLLAGMIMEESYGDPVQPNASGDGGLGLAHIQGVTATGYGLRIFGSSSRSSDRKHGRQLQEMLKRCNYDPACAQQYDERGHALKLLDTAARIVVEGKRKHGTWQHGVQHYRMPGRVSGRTAIRYRHRVERWQKNIISPQILRQAAADFNGRNSEAFTSYMQRFHDTNRDWGLDHYR